MRITIKKDMEIVFVLLFGWIGGFILGGSYRMSKHEARINRCKYLEKEYLRLTSEVSRLEMDNKKERNSLLDLRRRYDKIYNNKYNKLNL